jgi:hypothetical protein
MQTTKIFSRVDAIIQKEMAKRATRMMRAIALRLRGRAGRCWPAWCVRTTMSRAASKSLGELYILYMAVCVLMCAPRFPFYAHRLC